MSDLEDQIRRVDPDRWLSSRFIDDAAARADVLALYAYDHELARAPKVASNALLGEIRLTWWREVLDEVFDGRAVRAHPTAQTLADVIGRRGLDRGPLEAMIDGRYRELDRSPMTDVEAVDWARDCGGQAAGVAVSILDPAADWGFALAAGSAWALSRRLAAEPGLQSAFDQALNVARSASRHLSAKAFPAVAHVALLTNPPNSELGKRLRLTWAVARGRV